MFAIAAPNGRPATRWEQVAREPSRCQPLDAPIKRNWNLRVASEDFALVRPLASSTSMFVCSKFASICRRKMDSGTCPYSPGATGIGCEILPLIAYRPALRQFLCCPISSRIHSLCSLLLERSAVPCHVPVPVRLSKYTQQWLL